MLNLKNHHENSAAKALAWCPWSPSILASGGGKDDGKIEGEELQLPSCRFKVPFYPIDEAKFIFPFEEDCNEEIIKKKVGRSVCLSLSGFW